MSPRPLARLAPLVRPYTSRLVVAFLFLVVAAAAGLVFPAVLRYLLDAAFELKDRGALDRIALGLLGVFAVQGVANFVQVFLLSSSTERIVATLREQTFAHLIRLSPAFFTERRTGELTSRLSSDLALLQSLLSTWISELSRQTLFLIGGIAMMFVTNPRLTLTTLAVVPVVVVAAFTFGRALRKASTSVQDRIGEAMGMADESFGSIRTVQSFTREGIETERFSALLHDLVGVAVSRARIRALFFGVVGFVAFGSVAAVLWQGGAQVVEGKLTAGTLVAFLFYALFVAAAVGTLATLFGNFQEAIGAASRVFDLLDAEPTVREPEHPRRFTETVRGAVTLEAVAFRYQPDLPDVVQDISLDIAPGEVVALVGRSGAGKTTIASLLPRFWDVTAGRITLDGIDIRELSLDTLRGAIGIVPQEPVLFSGSIRENIAYARPDASDADVLRAAQAAHAWEFIERLPEQWSTRVGERGVKLSGGQRQDPAVVILDEATSSLDTESERYVEQALEQLLQGRTTLLIAHRLSTVRRADRVVVLDQGRIVETGSHDELLQRENGLFARLHQLS
jgi:subfamily B ATP-binding cassette protein MsbA